MNPILRQTVVWSEWGENFLLYNPQNRATLRFTAEDKQWIEGLDGTVSLHDIESNATVSKQLEPNHMLSQLDKLCKGNFLENSIELFAFLFPNQKMRSWAPRQRQWHTGVLWTSKVDWKWKAQDLSLVLITSMVLFITGLALMFMKHQTFAVHPWEIQNSWLLGSLASYLICGFTLSLGTLLQLSLMAGQRNPVDVQVKHTFGILHLATLRHPIFHSSIALQRQFAGLGIASILLMIGICWIVDSQLATGWGASCAMALLLLLTWDLCPFYDSNGAQLLETVTIHKQRLRTQDFLRSSFLSNTFGEIEGQKGLRITLSIWLLWFGVAIHLLGQSVLPHIGTLLIQTLQQPSLGGQLWLGFVSISICFYYIYFIYESLRLSGNLLEQIIPSSKKIRTHQPTSAEQAEWDGLLSAQNFTVDWSNPRLHITKVPQGLRLDQRTSPEQISVVLSGDVACIEPKPEGGFETLLHIPAPSPLLCPNLHRSTPYLWSATDCIIATLPYQAAQWIALSQTLQVIQSTRPFSELPEAWQWLLAIQTQPRLYPEGDRLILKGSPADALYLLHEGTCAIHSEQRPEPTIQLEAPTILGEMGILSESPRNADVLCLKQSLVYAIPSHLIRVCLQQHPVIQQWFGAFIQQRLDVKAEGSDESQ